MLTCKKKKFSRALTLLLTITVYFGFLGSSQAGWLTPITNLFKASTKTPHTGVSTTTLLDQTVRKKLLKLEATSNRLTLSRDAEDLDLILSLNPPYKINEIAIALSNGKKEQADRIAESLERRFIDGELSDLVRFIQGDSQEISQLEYIT